MVRGFALAVVAAPQIQVGDDRAGAEEAGHRLDRIVKDAFIGDDLDEDIGTRADGSDVQRLPQDAGASLVCLERSGCVAFEVEVRDVVVTADGLRLGGKVGADQHWYDLFSTARRGLPNACHVTFQLVDGRADEPGGTVCLDPDDKQPVGPAVLQSNESVDLGVVAGSRDVGERGNLGRRESMQQIADGIHGCCFQGFLYFNLFHHPVKSTKIMKLFKSAAMHAQITGRRFGRRCQSRQSSICGSRIGHDLYVTERRYPRSLIESPLVRTA